MRGSDLDDRRYTIMPDGVSIYDNEKGCVVTRLSQPKNAILFVAGMNRAHRWARQ